MIDRIFPVLFDMSLGASFVIAAVLLLRLFCHRFPRKYFLILWAVVLLRLLCPILPESELSVIPSETVSFAQETALPAREEVTVLSAADAALRAVGDTLNGGIDTVYVKLDREVTEEGTPPTVRAYHDQIWLLFLEKLWLGGIIVLVLRQIILDIRLRRRLKTAIPCPADLPAGLLPDRCRVYLADNIPTAFVLGLFRPAIYLPSDLSADAAVYVLAHESVHIRRLDPLWKLLSAAALCLHW
ncbi:MAG: peptidase M56, partial [Clostridia bacterium]|nr:peptidase M56 [Clostridia bacterium]